MKKYAVITWIICFMYVITSIPVHGQQVNEKTNEDYSKLNFAEDVKSAILIERDTGKLLYDKNAHEQLPPASMTKIMTLLLIMEELEKGKLQKDEVVRVSENAASMGGSQVFLEAGEEMTVNDLIKGVAIASGNDASVALAERIAGSEEAFVEKMNKKVSELGLENTKFQNVSGLPAEEHYSTAFDMAIISKELLKYESITEYTSIYEDYLRKGQENEFWLVNTNKLVKFYPGVDGLKTGYTNEAKYCLTATAKKGDMRVISVVMGANTIKKRNAVTSQMLDYAFNHYETKQLFKKGQIITRLDLLKAEQSNFKVITPQSLSILYKKGEEIDNITTSISINNNIKLPLNKGDAVGFLTIYKGKDIIGKSELVVEQPIEKASYFTLLKRAMQDMSKAK
ncbi:MULTISPECIES: D-alanyl-D-alanine carboxypeptidase family protein [unclassified Virgibacillus]|uniref:D-alanyl-D-alanine carboxypeptidase family protein n=1 Tax=unclassified Virgibacillus TaxID=2620237 RepID=UPI0024DE0097|nr:D-alanyl-D-alanine carboxypeptidase family protein [Virgibacillus sp. LDC-1]